MAANAEAHSVDVDVTIDTETGEVIATVTGTVDFTNVDELRRQLLELVCSGARRVLVDLDDADLVDPTTAAALVHVESVAKHHGVSLGIAVQPGSVTEKTLARCGLLHALSDSERRTGLPGHW